MATAITEDFVTKNGIVVQGTSAVTSSTGQSNALQVDGGAGIAKNIIVGTTATIVGKASVGGTLTVSSDSYLDGMVTATGVVSITDSTAATTSSIGALVVTGGIYAGSNLIVLSTNASTSTLTGNSLYVAGGVGIGSSLFVHGPAVFENDVTFTGATTYVYSTNTVYTDNLVEIHVPSNTPEWLVDDGKDIGLRFHYFSNTGTNAALVLSNDSKYLEWYGSGAESNTGTFSGATYGTFKTGNILLTNTATASSTNSGALQVVGGIGLGGSIYSGESLSASSITDRELTQGRVLLVGESGKLTDFSGLTYNTATNVLSATVGFAVTATNLAGGGGGSIAYQSNTGTTNFIPIGPSGYVLLSVDGIPTWTTFSGITTGQSTTASNFSGGGDTLIPFQNGVGSTAFSNNFKFDYSIDTFKTVKGLFTSTVNASSTITGAVQVVGGVGVGQDLFVGGKAIVVGDLVMTNGAITTTQTTFNLVNTTATTVNFAGSGTAITIGANSGYTAIRNLTTITDTTNATSTNSGALQVYGGVGIGGNLYVTNDINVVGNETISGDLTVNGGDFNTNQATFNLVNTTATTVNFAGSGTAITIGASNGYTAVRSLTTLTNTTNATSTNSGALQVYGGVGIGGNLYVGTDLYIVGNEYITGDLSINGGDLNTNQATFNLLNTTATTVNFAGAATVVNIGSNSGYTVINNLTTVTSTVNAGSTNSGALQVVGGVGIARDLFVGGNEVILGDLEIRGGDLTTNQTTFNLINATASTINFGGAGTAITIGTTTGYTEIKNATTITNATASTSPTSGALRVVGGTGIEGKLYVGGATVLTALTATITTSTTLTVLGTAGVAGVLSATEGTNANAINNGALRVTGGVGISRDMVVGGLITAGVTDSNTTGTSVSGFYSNNTLLASFTSNVISGGGTVSLDTFSSTLYRSAKYFIQIVDGANVHISEISLFHDGVKAYLSEYGISTNNGQLGTFDATWDASNVTVNFTPTGATAMIIKMTRTTIRS